MDDSNGLILFVLALIIAVVWLAIKLSNAKGMITALEGKNAQLNNQNSKLHQENTRLVADNAMLEAEHLKFQLQPHTLGNVVTTLHALAKNLQRGTESLSQSLNYILYKGNTHLVSVEDEIDFIKGYIQLNELLYSDIISSRIDISQVNRDAYGFKQSCIPHLISAYMVENAFKHGDKSHPNFLNIIIKLSDQHFEMLVINRIKPQATNNKVGGLGLKNMEKRLELLHSGKYEIKRSCNEQEYHSKLTIRF
jgi:LytS/YehU family sensor histidine kinase